MGLVDYAVTAGVAVGGATLAAPWLAQKLGQPALAESLYQHKLWCGLLACIGGAIGILLIPPLTLLSIGFGGLLEHPVLLVALGLTMFGSLLSVGIGALVLREPKTAPQLPLGAPPQPKTLFGLVGVAYGGFMFLLNSAVMAAF